MPTRGVPVSLNLEPRARCGACSNSEPNAARARRRSCIGPQRASHRAAPSAHGGGADSGPLATCARGWIVQQFETAIGISSVLLVEWVPARRRREGEGSVSGILPESCASSISRAAQSFLQHTPDSRHARAKRFGKSNFDCRRVPEVRAPSGSQIRHTPDWVLKRHQTADRACSSLRSSRSSPDCCSPQTP